MTLTEMIQLKERCLIEILNSLDNVVYLWKTRPAIETVVTISVIQLTVETLSNRLP
jgi:hypothetical protein